MSKWILHFDHITLRSSLSPPYGPPLTPPVTDSPWVCIQQSSACLLWLRVVVQFLQCVGCSYYRRCVKVCGVFCLQCSGQPQLPAASGPRGGTAPTSAGLSASPQAVFRGVSPSRFLADTSAPWDRKSFTCSSIPRRATTWRGVIFVSLVNTLTSAPPVTSSSAHLKRVETQPYDLIIHWHPHQQTHLPYNF